MTGDSTATGFHSTAHPGRAAIAACLLAGCGNALLGLVERQQRPVHHAVQRPARADHRHAGHRVREADRHHGQRPQRRRGHAGRPDRDRGQPVPRRRDLHRELPAAGVPAGQGPAGHGGRRRTLATTPARYNSPQGDWVGVSARVSVLIYNPSLIKASQLPTSVIQLADAEVPGQAGARRRETDFQPIVTSVLRALRPGRHACAGCKAIKANAAGHIYPDNETIAAEVNRGAVAFGHRQPVLLVPDAGRDRRGQHPLEDHLLRAARSRLRRSTSPAPRC